MATKKQKLERNVSIKNRRATFDYEIIERYTSGLVLVGSEIKSIRLGKAGLVDSYCFFINDELWIKGMYIAEYFYATYNNHKERRDRKLLLSKRELGKLKNAVKTPGITIIPIKLFINERGYAKLEIGVARGKKLFDKRASIKEREDKRAMDRAFKR
ncbi:single-stranded DNA-binding protein [Porphyromonas gingivicanis]|uniref:SsrA-binding protein n=1 Tax=Porphyromonas gingivicanis TaxID=266762 RepID=A0A0A2GCF7_9PORP|nr:SsrA-binding protein SmpB [Porphyromonas gingivicanis]KGN98139.1 single-stranded DNA-binding protein [Porphyromonas gingivicanis]